MIRCALSTVLTGFLLLSACAGLPRSPEAEPVPEKVEVTEQAPVPAGPESPAVFEDIPLKLSPSAERSFALPVPRAALESPPVYPWAGGTDAPRADPFIPVIQQPQAEAQAAAGDEAPDGGNEGAAVSTGSDRLPAVSEEPVREDREKPPETREETPEAPSEAYDLGSLEAQAGVPFDYSIEGEGWIFEGSDPEGIRFIRRTVPGGYTEFTLSAPENGTYYLNFLYNNILDGRAERAVLTLRLGMTPETEAALWVEEPEEPEEKADIPPTPEEVVALGFYEALSEADEAVKAGDTGRALEILHLCARVFQDSRNLDRVYFAIASIYEHIGPSRDINRAIFYYRKIIDTFPASIFYNRSRDRIVYLERNFIRIR